MLRPTTPFPTAVLLLLLVAGHCFAADVPPGVPSEATMSRDMMAALARLAMSPEQARQFGAVVQSITSSQLEMARKALRRNKPGVDRTIRKKTRRIINKHDEDVKTILNPEQFKVYEDEVKDALYAELTRPPRRDEGQRTTYESREGSGAGGGGCTWC